MGSERVDFCIVRRLKTPKLVFVLSAVRLRRLVCQDSIARESWSQIGAQRVVRPSPLAPWTLPLHSSTPLRLRIYSSSLSLPSSPIQHLSHPLPLPHDHADQDQGASRRWRTGRLERDVNLRADPPLASLQTLTGKEVSLLRREPAMRLCRPLDLPSC